jgi:multidrug efflux pump subunit AcrA (membrane-fusion protein)
VYPTVETMTRTLRARVEFANPGLMLKPGMYADVLMEAPSGKAVAIPEEAVLDSGTRKIVFVKEGEGTFVPREVTLGARAAGYYPVLSGVSEGEEVVSSPGFLIDSESRLQAAQPKKAAVAPAPRKPAGGATPSMPGMNMGGGQ